MKNQRTKKQLLDELSVLHQRVSELEQSVGFYNSIQERYQLLFEGSRDGYAMINMKGHILEYNSAFRNMLGYSDTELHEMTYKDLSPSKWHQMEGKIIQELLAKKGNTHCFEKEYRRKDGTIFPVELRTYLTISSQEESICMWAFVRDITERKKKLEALRESEEVFRLLFDKSGDANLIIEEDRFVDCNVAALKITGCSHKSQLLNLTPADISPARQPDGSLSSKKAEEMFEIAYREGSNRFEWVHKRFDGAEFYLDVMLTSISLNGRRFLYTAWRDITERKIVEDQLKESQQRLTEIIDFLPDATFVIDGDGKVVAWNRSMESMTGVRAEEMLGKGDKEYSIPFYGKRRPALVDLVMQENLDAEKSYVTIKRQGDKIYAEAFAPYLPPGDIHLLASASIFRNFEGKVVGAIECIRDNTEQKRIEAQLALDHERLTSILDRIPMPVFMIDHDRTVFLWNRYMELYTGKTKDMMIGRKLDLTFLFKGGVPPTLAEVVLQMTDDEILEQFGSRGVKKCDHLASAFETNGTIWLNNEERMQSIRAARIYDSQGKVVGAIQTSQDITEQVRAEDEKQKVQAQLFSAQKMEAIGTLAGGIAHDFNNILASIIGNTEMALYILQDDSVRKYLDHVMEAGDRAKKLINQILTFSHSKEQERKPVNMRLIAHEALELLSSTLPSTIGIRQHISTEYAMVFADPTKIYQIIMNLCTNAAHAMRDKGGILDITIADIDKGCAHHADLRDIAYVHLTIRDNGHGIDPAILDKIYHPFFTTKKSGEGSGLGLSVVYGIVKSYDGTITVESEVGKGTVFNVFLPSIQDTVVFQEGENVHVALIKGEEQILCVDDEEMIVILIHEFLESIGYKVVSTTSCLEALSIFMEDPHRFDLVITDMTMPQMTGLELTKKIQAIRPEIPIILCTGYNEMFTDDDIKRQGIKELIIKPILLKNLALCLRRAIEQ